MDFAIHALPKPKIKFVALKRSYIFYDSLSLPPKMKVESIYFWSQDTLKGNLLKTVPDGNINTQLDVKRNTIQTDIFSIDRFNKAISETEKKSQKPTLEQIRYWRWKKEQGLLIDSSLYMKPISKIQVIPTVKLDDKTLILPSYQRQVVNTDWLTLILILILVIFASVQHTFSKYLGQLYQSMFNTSVASRMYREKNNSAMQGAFRLELTFYLVFSLFIYQTLSTLNLFTNLGNFMRYLLSLALVFGFYILKKGLYKFLGFVIEAGKETSEYLFHHDNFNRILGLILYPLVSFIAFYPVRNDKVPIGIGFTIVILFYLMILQRGVSIFTKKQFSIFYLFLYLCTLEFLPLLLLIGVIASQ